jgi:amino acid permease
MEYSSVVEHYYGPAWKRVFDVVLSLTLLVASIASAVIAAQAIDQIFLTTCGRTWALQLRPSLAFVAFIDISILYSNEVIAISLG